MSTPREEAALAVAGAVRGVLPVGLDEVLERAALQVRMDRKYLVPAAAFTELAARLDGAYSVLEIGGLRSFRYSSTYFDTPDLLTYHRHRQGRRRRFKIRTRAYLDSGECMLEVKLNGARDATDKRRMPYSPAAGADLTPEGLRFVGGVLLESYRANMPEPLGRAATTRYHRSTFVQRTGTGRFTCDTGLVCAGERGEVAASGGLVLLESKSAASIWGDDPPGPPATAGAIADAPVDQELRRLGLRPLSLSKYCLAVAVLHPRVPANPWDRALRRYFGGRPGGGERWMRPWDL